MNKKTFIKIFTTLFFTTLFTFYCCTSFATNTSYQEPKTPYELNPRHILAVYADNSTSSDEEIYGRYEVTSEMISNKTAIIVPSELNYSVWTDNMITSADASTFLGLLGNFYADSENVNALINQIASNLSINSSDIELQLTYSCDAVTVTSETIPSKKIVLSSKTSSQEDCENATAQIRERNIAVEMALGKCTSERDYTGGQFYVATIKAIVPDRNPYYLVVGNSGEFKNKFYFVSPNIPIITNNEFTTQLSYEAYVGTTSVGGTGTSPFLPSFDKNTKEKDANVTATIKSNQSGVTISSVSNNALKDDGTPNDLGWFYIDKNDKTKIAKVYKFDDYNNETANGMITEENLVITGSNGLQDTKTVAIKWPFRIIKETQTPETIDKTTTSVRYEITTNLPINPQKLPEGWEFTDDELGKSHHKIFIVRSKNYGDYIKDIELTANGRSDTVSTKVSIKFAGEELPKTHAKTGEVSLMALIFVSLGLVLVVIKLRKKMK